jgi:hypothetical protein
VILLLPLGSRYPQNYGYLKMQVTREMTRRYSVRPTAWETPPRLRQL